MAEHDIWTIRTALEWCCGYLERKGDEHPRLSAEWLLSEACGLRRVELYVNFDKPLSPDERDRLREFVRRRGAGEPLQYITGEVAFRHITLKVRPGVLIPRPETEVLVSEALAMLPAIERRHALDSSLTEDEAAELMAAQAAAAAAAAEDEAASEASAAAVADDGESVRESASAAPGAASGQACASASEPAPEDTPSSASASAPALDDELVYVADLCCGTGCIACSIAYEYPRARVLATDISPEACALARENVAALDMRSRVHVLQCNLGDAIEPRFIGSLDLVVSNPPYIPTAALAKVPREVADFEPALALDGGPDGLSLFRPIVSWSLVALAPGGALAVELDERCMDAAAACAREAGFVQVRVVDDLAGRPRVLTARTPSA